MNGKNLGAIAWAALILAALGLGIVIVYSDYLYSPTSSLDALQVVGQGEPGSPSRGDARLLKAIEEWAEEEQATVLLKNGTSAGCGFCGFSDWPRRELGLEGKSGVYVSDDPGIQAAYVSGDVLLPGSAGLTIQGTYQSTAAPPVLQNVDFLYPLSWAPTAGGMYFTDAGNTDGLTALLDAHGYSVVSHRQANHMTVGQLLGRLIGDGFLSRAVLFAMTGLVFCFVYRILTLYRDNARKLWVHHLFGLSKGGILLGSLLTGAGTVAAAGVLFGGILKNGLTYLSRTDLGQVFRSTLAVYVLLYLFVHAVGCWQIFRKWGD